MKKPKGVSRPEELGRAFIERANSGDADGLAALYEPGAVLASPGGKPLVGRDSIHEFYSRLLSKRLKFKGKQSPALINGDYALTSTRFDGGATAEVAHRQPDGTWLWVIDLPNVLS